MGNPVATAEPGWSEKTRRFWAGSARWRDKYGTLAGLKLALALRHDYSMPAGSLFAATVPGLKHPLVLRAGSADLDVFTQLLGTDALDFPLPQAPRYILDAGANVGIASAIFATRFPAAEILAVEPEPGNFAVLQRNAAQCPQITPLRAAVWNADGLVELSETRSGLEHRVQVHGVTHTASAREVPALTISSLLERAGWPRFDLVKLDIEGSEVEVLGQSELAWLAGVSVLVAELHDRFRPGCRAAFDHALAGRGFGLSSSGEYLVAVRGQGNPAAG